MNKEEAKNLRNLIKNITLELEHINELIDEFSTPKEGRADAPSSLSVGTIVRAYAEWANKDGESLFGDLATVTESPDPESIGCSFIIKIQKGPYKGQDFRILAQQCVVVKKAD
jgi:hypothetical protein